MSLRPLWGLGLLLLLGPALGCLLCAPELKELLEDLLIDYIPDHSKGAEQARAVRVVEELIGQYGRYSQMAEPVLQKTMIVLKREISGITKQKLKGHYLANALVNFANNSRVTIGRLSNHFTNHVECSNICGNFTVKYLRCSDCVALYMTCVMKIRCAVSELTVGIDDEIRLNCFEPWHRITSNFQNYIYSKGPLGSRHDWQFEEMRETDESSLVILQVRREHQQTYRCVVMGNEGAPIADKFYDVTVGERISIPTETGETHPPLVQEEGLEPERPTPSVKPRGVQSLNLISVVAIVIVSVALVSLVAYTCYRRVRRKGPGDAKIEEMMQLIQ
ncbi:izumo sperm-egg fusion protein 1 [Scyliorhinus torazame]|uniref:izumo sperm-egg fusion protein 1 n=1 Tax=Scyliorhinus torazame TaxID=75743 RepID=UPI003B58F1C1